AGTTAVVTFGNQITGSGGLTKLGTGTLVLSNAVGAASTYTGQTTVAAGALNVQSGGGLGASAAVVVAGGAALQLQANLAVANGTAAPGFAVSRPLFLNGGGVAGGGALESVFGVNSVTGGVTLNTAAAVGVDAGT